MANNSIIISLVEPISVLQESICKHTGIHEYNYVSFLNTLFLDILDDNLLIHENDRYVAGDTPEAVKVLVKDGMQEEAALHLTLTIFQLVIDCIVAVIPNIDFGQEGYIFRLCNEVDLCMDVTYAQ
ncbi:MAG: hypothetical protein ACD_84C00034G0002 [uncultured bacterium]|nr:MAG: hypothetical protein ACD_84C00034G0002 [uncultured bacterium]